MNSSGPGIMEIDLGNLLNSGLTPEVIQYYKCLEDRKIILNSEIACCTLELATLPLKQMDEDGTGERIEIILNTLGGSAYDGFALVDVIEKVKTPLTIRIMGLAASMGFLIAMAHTNNPNVETVCSKYSAGLMHSGFLNPGYIPTHDTKDYMEFNNAYEDIVRQYVLSHTKITEEYYSEIYRKQFWMTADKMLELGVVSRIE